MGLLDSVLGAIAGNAQSAGNTSGGGGLQDILNIVSNNPQLIQVATSLLSNNGSAGGLEGLVSKFQQAGMGDVIASWISSGQNQAISGAQLSSALGPEMMTGLAGSMGANTAGGNTNDLASQLATMLPGLIDQLTPSGQAPAGGLGNSGDLMGVLGTLLKA
jgi:uncharacterized protein YidB (DUF937 family)